MSENSATFVEYDKGNPILKVVINDFEYGFSVKDHPEQWREWLRDILLLQMTQVHERAYRNGQRSVRDQIKNALGF